jgi:fructose-1,6-bisphosphatase/inositol monophosphatase family enzyme
MRPVSTAFAAWEAPLRGLCDELRATTRAALDAARARGRSADLARPVGQGKGDVTFGLDAPAEAVLDRWLAEQAARGPLSLLTEDSGWRHLGPAGALPGFDHGGPRIAVDPIDGTRNLMVELRSAWTVVSFAGPGAGVPRLSELSGGLIAEIPTRVGALYRVLAAARGGGTRSRSATAATGAAARPGSAARRTPTTASTTGYFPVFRYKPDLRPGHRAPGGRPLRAPGRGARAPTRAASTTTSTSRTRRQLALLRPRHVPRGLRPAAPRRGAPRVPHR